MLQKSLKTVNAICGCGLLSAFLGLSCDDWVLQKLDAIADFLELEQSGKELNLAP